MTAGLTQSFSNVMVCCWVSVSPSKEHSASFSNLAVEDKTYLSNVGKH
jgi:hypothetical protein